MPSPDSTLVAVKRTLMPRLRTLQGWRQQHHPDHEVTLGAVVEWLVGLGEAEMKKP